MTSDFIVGFCGETEDEFQQTVDLVREARFKNSFIFKYSPRPGTEADRAVRRRRPRGSQAAAEQRIAGRPECDLVWKIISPGRPRGGNPGGRPEQDRPQAWPARGATCNWSGRTVCDRIVVFNGPLSLTGRMMRVEVRKADDCTLFGELPGALVRSP